MKVKKYILKKWALMLLGKSIDHTKQPIGTQFIPGRIEGYFNDLTGKVLNQRWLLGTDKLPMVKNDDGNDVLFPVAIMQYGLGAYDLYLKTKEYIYLKKFLQCVDWTLNNQIDNGAWDNFSVFFPNAPYGAMCQGEGASLLLRAYCHTKELKYLNAAQKAIDFMLTPVDSGGVCEYIEGQPILLECTNSSMILNGSIFAIMGLYEMQLVNSNYKLVFDKCVMCLCSKLNEFDSGYWSYYDLEGHISSPFYHKLHIAQISSLKLITEDKRLEIFLNKLKYYEKKRLFKMKAFFIKVKQKVFTV